MSEPKKVCACGAGMGVVLDGDQIRLRVPHSSHATTVPLPDGLRGSDVAAIGVMPLTVLTTPGMVWHHGGGSWQRVGSVHDSPPPAPPPRGPRVVAVAGATLTQQAEPRLRVVALRSIGCGAAGVAAPLDIIDGPASMLRELLGQGRARRPTLADEESVAALVGAR